MKRRSQPATLAPVFACAVSAAIAAGSIGLPLFQDGASYLLELLATGSAVRHHRLSARLVELPAILARRLVGASDDIALVRTVFSLGYALVPVVALALAWVIVRRTRPDLIIWPALVILFVNLVDFSWVSELLIAMQVTWVLLLAWLVAPGTRRTVVVTVVLVPFVWWLHPLSAPLLAAVGVACALVARRSPDVRLAARTGAAVHGLAALTRVIAAPLLLTPYESGFLEPPELVDYLFTSHWENLVVLSAALAIAALVATRPASGVASARRYGAAAALAVAAGLVLGSQFFAAGHTFSLKTGLAVVTSLVLMTVAAVDAGMPARAAETPARVRLTTVLAAVFAAVVVAKCVAWHAATTRLHEALAAGDARCRETDALAWLRTAPNSIIDTWALPSLALVLQDRPPRRLLLAPGDCRRLAETGLVRIDPWTALPAAALVPPLD